MTLSLDWVTKEVFVEVLISSCCSMNATNDLLISFKGLIDAVCLCSEKDILYVSFTYSGGVKLFKKEFQGVNRDCKEISFLKSHFTYYFLFALLFSHSISASTLIFRASLPSCCHTVVNIFHYVYICIYL